MIRNARLEVPSEAAGTRLRSFLASAFPALPGKSLRHALERGHVLVNGAAGAKGTLLAAGDRVRVREMAEPEDWLPVAGDVPGASVLYQDGHLVVLDKPPRVHTEPQRPLEGGTLAGYLLHVFPSVLAVAPVPGLTLATRLDHGTSGAVAAALTPEGARHLAREGEGGRIEKEYAAVVEGVLRGELVLSDRIEAEGGEKVRVRRGVREEDPHRWTRVTAVGAAGEGRTLVRASIRKGRRHQIRAHLAAAGFPIVGDGVYGTPGPEGGAGRLLLHAERVTFRGLRGETVTAVSPLPPEFRTGG